MQRAMAREAEAERERRAKVINARGELQSLEELKQASTLCRRARPHRSCATCRPCWSWVPTRTRRSCSTTRRHHHALPQCRPRRQARPVTQRCILRLWAFLESAVRRLGATGWAALGIIGLVVVAALGLSAVSGILIPLIVAVILGWFSNRSPGSSVATACRRRAPRRRCCCPSSRSRSCSPS